MQEQWQILYEMSNVYNHKAQTNILWTVVVYIKVNINVVRIYFQRTNQRENTK